MRKLASAVGNPRLYIIWAILVVLALLATYFVDPYIFAFTTFGLVGISVVIGLVGLTVALPSKAVNSRAKGWIIVSVTTAVAASLAALALLGSFKWS